jgi:formate dehydrogenase (coenzyme F420) beta subunit
MKNTVNAWLQENKVDLFLAYKIVDGHPLPYVFDRENLAELEEMVAGPSRYALEKVAAEIVAERPDVRVGLLVRDCTERSLNVLFTWNQLNPDNVETLQVNCCPSKLKEHADCSYLGTEKCGALKKQIGIDNTMDVEELESYDQQERFSRWMHEFQKCLKCYGCRNVCPVCFCRECGLENTDLVGKGEVPPEAPIFHLVRAVHMAGRCVDCGLCEEACPVNIPLRLLYARVNAIVKELFDYEPGTSQCQSPFTILRDTLAPESGPVHAVA